MKKKLVRFLLLTWLIFFAALAAFIFGLATDRLSLQHTPTLYATTTLGIGGVAGLIGLYLLICWSGNRRNFGRLLVGLAVSVTLLALSYLEEDWRGKRAWDQVHAKLETLGVDVDWSHYIPPPIPDDQNFYTASSNILVRFHKAQTPAEAEAAKESTWLRIDYGSIPRFSTKTNPLVVVNLVVSSAANHSSNDTRLDWQAPDAVERVQSLLKKITGRDVEGAAGFKLTELDLSRLSPAQITLDTAPALSDLKNLVPENLATNLGRFKVEATGNGNYRILLTGGTTTAATDYLQWSDQYVPAMNEIREALKRPCAMLPGDYSIPSTIPIPNFVVLRYVAQNLAQRAQCDLLLNRPDQALQELTLLHELCRILERPPTGQPLTLVEAMINVAIHGLYVSTIADGFRSHAWQEPQIRVLQNQLATIDLPPQVRNGFKNEIVHTSTMLLIASPERLQAVFEYSGHSSHFWDHVTSGYWLLYAVPRGWLYQNTAFAANLEAKSYAVLNQSNGLFLPEQLKHCDYEVEAAVSHWSPWGYWAAICIPNYRKAELNTAHAQTLINEAQVVCALERYRLTNGAYPAALDDLLPHYLTALPQDLIGGERLHYHRTEDGKFLLYSIGWNETDDGGQILKDPRDWEKGDWVWQ